MECLFCNIVAGNLPSKKIYEDDLVLAFLDIYPDSVGHTLIIPKKHYVELNDIDEQTLFHVMKISKLLKKRIEEKLNCDGVVIMQNNGEVQEIKHYHLHLKPYYKTKKDKTVEEVFQLLK